MLKKGALEPVDHPDRGYYSCLFLVQKVTGRWHPVINLSSLNDYITFTEFKMETDWCWGRSGKGIIICSRGTSKTPTFRYPFIQTLNLIFGSHLTLYSHRHN